MAACVRWLGGATLAWALLLVAEAAGTEPPASGGVSFLVLLGAALRWSLACSLVLAIPHAAVATLAPRHRHAHAFIVGAVAAAAVVPGLRLGEFLASGEWISQQRWAIALRAGVAVGFVLATAGAWTWHLLLLGDQRAAASLGRPLARPSALPLLALAGVLALAPAAYLVVRDLHAYEGLALAILPFLWLGTATIAAFLAARMVPWRDVVTGACALVLAAATWAALNDAATPATSRSRLASLAARALAPAPPAWVGMDVSGLEPGDCEAPRPPGRLPALPLPRSSRRNVILICIDTLRADVPSVKLGGRLVMPQLTAFRAGAVDFRGAQTTYPATLLAVGGALSGRSPSRIFFAAEPPPTIFTLTGDLFDETLVVWPDAAWFRRESVHRLFARGTSPRFASRARQQVDLFLGELRRARGEGHAVLAWLHLYDLHGWSSRRVADLPRGSTAPYYGEAAAIDQQFGRVLAALRADGWLDDSLVVVFADHGEALGERGVIGHQIYLTPELVNVPLVLSVPRAAPARTRAPVSLLDIAPTVLHFMDVAVPEMDGRSLFLPPQPDRAVFSEAMPVRGQQLHEPASRGVTGVEDLERRLAGLKRGFAGHTPKMAVVRGDFRLVVDRVTGEEALYRISTDPHATRNVLDEFPAERAELEETLGAWNARHALALYCDAVRAGGSAARPRDRRQ